MQPNIPQQQGPMLPPQPGQVPLPQYPNTPYPAPGGPPQPKKHHAWGLIISLILSVLLLLGAVGFAFWAFTSRQDYKNDSDQKAAKAVAIAVQEEDSKKDNEFIEKEKSPLKEYQGPSSYGSLDVSYPKTWSAYVAQDQGSLPLDAYFHPSYVPGLQSKTAYALRIQVTNQTYDQEMKLFDSKVKSGKVTVKPYSVKRVPTIQGARVEGEINIGQQDIMVLMPLRDKTLKISTESPSLYQSDFDNIILNNISFSP